MSVKKRCFGAASALLNMTKDASVVSMTKSCHPEHSQSIFNDVILSIAEGSQLCHPEPVEGSLQKRLNNKQQMHNEKKHY